MNGKRARSLRRLSLQVATEATLNAGASPVVTIQLTKRMYKRAKRLYTRGTNA